MVRGKGFKSLGFVIVIQCTAIGATTLSGGRGRALDAVFQMLFGFGEGVAHLRVVGSDAVGLSVLVTAFARWVI